MKTSLTTLRTFLPILRGINLKKSKNIKDNALDLGRPSSSSSGIITVGLVVVGFIFVGVGIWSATAPLSEAVSAVATLTVKGERKKIQHLEGGIVSSLNVDEGEYVNENQLLVSLDPLQASATVAMYRGQLDQALVREARLESELKFENTITLDVVLLDRISKNEAVSEILEAEQKHLLARLDTVDATLAILNQRISQLNNEIEGLEIQRAARKEQLTIFEEELKGLSGLFQKGYYPKSGILAVERAIVELRGLAGTDLAQIARATSARGEASNQIVSVKKRFREDVIGKLRDVQSEISDLQEKVAVAIDVLNRIDIRAPRSGIVQGLNIHTVGGVVRPGDVLMEIAPQDDDLVVFAQVSPNDIDNVAVGQKAEVRLIALNSRKTPSIFGHVMSVSGDRLIDSRSETPYFLTQIEIPPKERQKIGDAKLTAGMPADVLIKTGERTVLNYLMKPMIDAFARGLNEE